MSKVLPILFNGDMVRAILDGRKTVTRRVVKVPPYYPHFYKLHDNADGALSGTKNRLYAGFYNNEKIFYIYGKKHVDAVYYQAPYQPGDILYVRETWCDDRQFTHYSTPGRYFYKASEREEFTPKWRPSIHMPKESARIWLKVKNVRVERLQDITEGQVQKEGIDVCNGVYRGYSDGIEMFEELWNCTIKKSDLDRYGWGANPWVWVIEFERREKPED